MSERRREIGVRVALGATAAQVITNVGGRGARPAIIGLGAGIVASIGIGRVMTSLVYGARPFDLEVNAAVIIVALVVVGSATFLAAQRALLVQPIEALKHE